jgi:excinuclease UvrABC nuclease subunit
LAKSEKRKILFDLTKSMNQAALKLEFEKAAEIRDEIALLEEKIR